MPADDNTFQHASALLLKLQRFNSSKLHHGFSGWRRLTLNVQLGFVQEFAGRDIIFGTFPVPKNVEEGSIHPTLRSGIDKHTLDGCADVAVDGWVRSRPYKACRISLHAMAFFPFFAYLQFRNLAPIVCPQVDLWKAQPRGLGPKFLDAAWLG